MTDFFVRLGRTDTDFRALLEQATPVPPAPPQEPMRSVEPAQADAPLRHRIRSLKETVPIATAIGRYVELHPSGETLAGLCPRHDTTSRRSPSSPTPIVLLLRLPGARELLRRLSGTLRAAFPAATLRIRPDGGFATAKLFTFLEHQQVEYVVNDASSAHIGSC